MSLTTHRKTPRIATASGDLGSKLVPFKSSWCLRGLCKPLRTWLFSHTSPSLILLKVHTFPSLHSSRFFSALYLRYVSFLGNTLKRAWFLHLHPYPPRKTHLWKHIEMGYNKTSFFFFSSYKFLVFKSWSQQACMGLCVQGKGRAG